MDLRERRDKAIEILRGVLRGEIKIQASEWPWVNMVATKGEKGGDEFWMSFFIDANELDYIDSFVTGDSAFGFDDLWDNETGTDPIDMLESSEVDELAAVIRRSEAEDPKALWNEWCDHPSNKPSNHWRPPADPEPAILWFDPLT
jgi:hypothetical protein